MQALVRLNLGSGTERVEGYDSVDLYAQNADHRVDLFRFPWPWADDSVAAVRAFNFLEHTHDLESTVREIIRILRPGGDLWLLCPHYRGGNATQLDHRQRIGWGTCQSLESGHWLWDMQARFERRLLRLNVGFGFNGIASRWPSAWEKVGLLAPEEIEWRGVLVKSKIR